MHSGMLPATRRLFGALGKMAEIRDFVLVGGTAIALHERHRLSEDLDFAQPVLRLDRRAIGRLLDGLEHEGFQAIAMENLQARQEFEIAGMELDNYHQDYAVDGVKLTFFVPDDEVAVILRASPATVTEGVPVASLERI